jgi:hypothetical protein
LLNIAFYYPFFSAALGVPIGGVLGLYMTEKSIRFLSLQFTQKQQLSCQFFNAQHSIFREMAIFPYQAFKTRVSQCSYVTNFVKMCRPVKNIIVVASWWS